MNPSEPTSAALSWRQHLVALFVTLHLVCVTISSLPRPPRSDNEILEMPEVQAELEASIGKLNRWLRLRNSTEELARDLLGIVRGYENATGSARSHVAPYMNLIGGEQSWHMFGGTPPRLPLLMMVDVQLDPQGGFVVFQDLNWGTSESKALNFRHRKVHENLFFWSIRSERDEYAAYWACRWDALHPEQPARAVRIRFLQLTTPTPAEVRAAGWANRQPAEVKEREHIWVRP